MDGNNDKSYDIQLNDDQNYDKSDKLNTIKAMAITKILSSLREMPCLPSGLFLSLIYKPALSENN